MTAFSFILGVFPLLVASGAGSRWALGTAVFGGVLAATVLGTFLVPLLYVLVQGATECASGNSTRGRHNLTQATCRTGLPQPCLCAYWTKVQ